MPAIAPGPSAWQAVKQFYRNPIHMFRDAQAEYGDIVRFAALGYELFQVTNPELAQHILRDPNFEMSLVTNHPFIGNGLANNSGDSWMQQRRLLQPYFHQRVIQNFTDTMTTAIQAVIAHWQQQTTLDIVPDLIALNHQILGATLLGIDFSAQPEQQLALHNIRMYINRRFQAIVSVPEFLPTPRNLRFRRSVELFDTMVHEKVANAGDGSALVDMLVHATDAKTGEKMSPQQLRDEINSLFFNGYEDVAMVVVWALYCLSQNPEAESRLREEIDHVLGNRPPQFEDIKQMTYLNAVLKETLRLYPTTWAVMRDAQAAAEIGGYHIPQGASVQVTIYLLHRHPEYWGNPDQFLPERFNDDYPEEAYMPFGSGSRQCIARQFAELQIKLTLVELLQHFEFELLPQTVELNAMASLRPETGLMFKLSRR